MSNSDTRWFHEHKLVVGGTTLCTMANIYACAVFLQCPRIAVKSKHPNGQI